MYRIIDVNINRASEALRVLEEITRFELNNENLSERLKLMRHKISNCFDKHYEILLHERNTENDVGIGIANPRFKQNGKWRMENGKLEKNHFPFSIFHFPLEKVFKPNIKRLQQALRVLAETTDASSNLSCREIFEQARYDSYTLEKEIWEQLTMKINKLRLQDKKLYLVTNSDKFESDDAFIDAVAAALKGGVQIVQLREKNRPANEIIALGKKIRMLCSEFDALYIVNDRIDIAQITNADGVHLGQDDIDVHSAREILGGNFIIGVSTHAPEQAQKAVSDGADYIGVGPVFSTPTKEGRTAVGLEYVKWAGENVEIPFFAIGGIDLDNVDSVINHGAKRIAIVRSIINAQNPHNVAKSFLQRLSKPS